MYGSAMSTIAAACVLPIAALYAALQGSTSATLHMERPAACGQEAPSVPSLQFTLNRRTVATVAQGGWITVSIFGVRIRVRVDSTPRRVPRNVVPSEWAPGTRRVVGILARAYLLASR